jgi:RNA polymerase sigma factor (sigma-70 family)
MRRKKFDDQSLLSGCLSGDREAAENLVRRFSDLVYKSIQYTLLARNVPFTKDDLDDFHQTVFLNLFENECKKLRQYKGKNGCSLRSWICIITVNTVRDHLRKEGIDSIGWRKKGLCLDDLPELSSDKYNPEAQTNDAERERILQNCVKKLPSRGKMIITLLIERELSVDEVAELMHLSTGNVYTSKNRLIQKLKKCMSSAEKDTI